MVFVNAPQKPAARRSAKASRSRRRTRGAGAEDRRHREWRRRRRRPPAGSARRARAPRRVPSRPRQSRAGGAARLQRRCGAVMVTTFRHGDATHIRPTRVSNLAATCDCASSDQTKKTRGDHSSVCAATAPHPTVGATASNSRHHSVSRPTRRRAGPAARHELGEQRRRVRRQRGPVAVHDLRGGTASSSGTKIASYQLRGTVKMRREYGSRARPEGRHRVL